MILEINPGRFTFEFLEGDPSVPITRENGFYYNSFECEAMKEYKARFKALKIPYALLKGKRKGERYVQHLGQPEVFYGLYVPIEILRR